MEIDDLIIKAIRDGFVEKKIIGSPDRWLLPFGFASKRYYQNDPGYRTREWVFRDFSRPRRKALPNEPYFNEQDANQHRLVQAMEYEQRRQELTYITEEEQELARQCIKKGEVQNINPRSPKSALKFAKLTYALRWNCYTFLMLSNNGRPWKLIACTPPDRKTIQSLRRWVCNCSEAKRASENSRSWIKQQQPFYLTAYKQFKESQSRLIQKPTISSWRQWWSNLQGIALSKDNQLESTKKKESETDLKEVLFLRGNMAQRQETETGSNELNRVDFT